MDTPLLGMLPEEAKAALGASVVYPKRLGDPDEYAKMALAIVDNDYLNGEVGPARRRHPDAAEVAGRAAGGPA